MLFILDTIISLTKVTVWGRALIPSCCLMAKGVNAEFKPSHAENDMIMMGEVKEHEERTTGDMSSVYCCAL
eukprot:788198-Pelagomonas_calceolata.AAC.1